MPPILRVESARIIPPDHFGGKSCVLAEMSNGEYIVLFSYFEDELSFLPGEFKGMTEEQAYNLFYEKDKQYLRS
jgi:hypothetical protein